LVELDYQSYSLYSQSRINTESIVKKHLGCKEIEMPLRKFWNGFDRGLQDEKDTWVYRFVAIAMVAALVTIVCQVQWLVGAMDEDLQSVLVLPLAFLVLFVVFILCHITLWAIRGMPEHKPTRVGGPSLFSYLD